MTMDKSTTHSRRVDREQRFRAPSGPERALGLWVDRIGRETVTVKPARLRILGQYCHIQVLKGSGVYLSRAAGEIRVEEGDCMIQFPEDPCLYYPHGTWTTCWVTWNGAEGRTLESLGYMDPHRPVFRDPGESVLRAFTALTPIIHNGAPAAALLRKAITLGMVEASFTAAHNTARQRQQDALMQRAVILIHERYNTRLTVGALAGALHLSTTHFRRLFHAYTGQSPMEYLLALRMAEARHLLRSGISIKQVAVTVGYDDLFYFMRVFRRSVGVPPGRFMHAND